jgi:hypothetical protein
MLNFKKVVGFLNNNDGKIILLINLFLISSLSFFAGYFYAYHQTDQHEIKFENSEDICRNLFFKDEQEKGIVQSSQNKNSSPQPKAGESVLENSSIVEKNVSDEKEKMLVGSKNSKVYHKPDCPHAKRILEKNKIWFDSKEEAESRGYRVGKCCHP